MYGRIGQIGLGSGWGRGYPLSYMAAGIGYPYGAIYPLYGGLYGYPCGYGFNGYCGLYGGVY